MKATAVVLLFSCLLASATAQCADNEALLKVTYSLTNDEWNELDNSGSKRLSIRPASGFGPGSSAFSETIDYYSFDELVDYEKCIPSEGSCLEVAVYGLATSTYEISWDGQPVEVTSPRFKGEFGDTITSTEVGDDCSPICDENTESLFEYKYWSSIGFEDYRVEDIKDGNVLMRCDHWQDECMDASSIYDSLHASRICLKKDACYRFLIGDNFQRIPGDTDIEFYYSLRWKDVDVMDRTAGKQFDSIEFGDACQPDCNPDEESMVEFFMHRVTDRNDCLVIDPEYPPTPEPDFTWELKVQDPRNDDSWSLDSSGVIPGCSNTSLYNEVICIPKESCAEFYILSPEGHEYVTPMYTLSMDDVIYKRRYFDIDSTSSSFEGLNQTTMIGSCSVETLCDEGEALIEVDVQTPDYIIADSFSWSLVLASTQNVSTSSYSHFDQSTDVGSKYSTIECVPDDGDCELEFQFPTETSVEYNVKRNGIELSDTRKREDGSGTNILFGEDCDGSGNGDSVENPGEASSGGESVDNAASVLTVSVLLLFVFQIHVYDRF